MMRVFVAAAITLAAGTALVECEGVSPPLPTSATEYCGLLLEYVTACHFTDPCTTGPGERLPDDRRRALFSRGARSAVAVPRRRHVRRRRRRVRRQLRTILAHGRCPDRRAGEARARLLRRVPGFGAAARRVRIRLPRDAGRRERGRHPRRRFAAPLELRPDRRGLRHGLHPERSGRGDVRRLLRVRAAGPRERDPRGASGLRERGRRGGERRRGLRRVVRTRRRLNRQGRAAHVDAGRPTRINGSPGGPRASHAPIAAQAAESAFASRRGWNRLRQREARAFARAPEPERGAAAQ